MKKYVYLFNEGSKEMKDLLGGKGANLAEMIKLGLPVPSGLTVTTEACLKYYQDNKKISKEIIKEIKEKVKELEKITGKKFGSSTNPLLLSVRSGAKISMPGMMDTVLNVGLNEEIVQSLIKETNNSRFVYDLYRRLIGMYADVVKGLPKDKFEEILDSFKDKKGVEHDTLLDELDLKEITKRFKLLYKELVGSSFPSDPFDQLITCVEAVFASWNNNRAITYRRLNNIPDDIGTAVNIQEMVYGNKGEDCLTGVYFSRSPVNGIDELYGEYLPNAQGEDIVAGIRTPLDINKLKESNKKLYDELYTYAKKLEHHYKDVQDIEFTVESNQLYLLQTRNGKRTIEAALKIAVDLVHEGLINKEEALLQINPLQLEQVLHNKFDEESLNEELIIGKGLPASPGAASGRIYFNASDIVQAKEKGFEDLILVRLETSPEDIEGMNNALGILTLRGGMTSHAAVVARGMGKCCVSGCNDLIINEEDKILKTKEGKIFKEGDYISLDGTTGNIYQGKIKTIPPFISSYFKEFMSWADDVSKLEVRANAETISDVKQALLFGAKGIGLCRTEHMFFDEERINIVREMIISTNIENRQKALDKLLPLQQRDFKELFRELKGYPITIRYLDPPLHEFLPKTEKDLKSLMAIMNLSLEELKERINNLKEFNPMMGHRGCRVAITYPEILIMQTKAVILAGIKSIKEGINVNIELMIPLVIDVEEIKYLKNIIKETIERLINESKVEVPYQIGTMIETPRACLLVDEISKEVSFFSFGTNDLTQMTYAFSRDDAEKFLNEYYRLNILKEDPFIKLDQEGVGSLINIALKKSKKINPSLKIGICGEHGGEPSSINFFHQEGFDYVSCSSFRIPIARLAELKLN